MPTKQLTVYRTLMNGRKIRVGELAENKQGIFFAYDTNYLSDYPNLSPFKLEKNTALQLAPVSPHDGLHGVFADSLPDGWGLLLQDRFFEANQLNLYQISPLDRLAFVGDTGIGALSFEPVNHQFQYEEEINLFELGRR
ncbi:HipA N-terminal domain-containing protein [Actinobacillus genomosp. 2]|nr:HipA N-terminal domain-containing protein [Actinobacillus genomosp. 2]WGE31644.1 HipA N-terminal domain-containing protein [Actinobacillus genomosp. 2]